MSETTLMRMLPTPSDRAQNAGHVPAVRAVAASGRRRRSRRGTDT
jgi:hypothetical protein